MAPKHKYDESALRKKLLKAILHLPLKATIYKQISTYSRLYQTLLG